MNNIFKLFLKKPLPCVMVFLALVISVFCLVLVMHIDTESISGRVGQEIGTMTGRAIGSLEGMTSGRTEGMEAGRNAGLSAVDTEASIADRIKEVEKLEVLVASVKLSDVHVIGEDKGYAALYLLKGDVIFTVDLSKATVVMQDEVLHIIIPKPEGELVIDQGKIEKKAEYQKHYFKGNTEAGFDAYLNSMAKIEEASAETLKNYDELIKAAENSAEVQVKQLASSSNILADDVVVEFLEEEDKNE